MTAPPTPAAPENEKATAIEPRIHSHIEDSLPESHPLAFKQVSCDSKKPDGTWLHDELLHAANNECMQTWVESGEGNFCWACFCNMMGNVASGSLALVEIPVAAATARLEERVRDLEVELSKPLWHATSIPVVAEITQDKIPESFVKGMAELDRGEGIDLVDAIAESTDQLQAARDTLAAQCVDLRTCLEELLVLRKNCDGDLGWRGHKEAKVDWIRVKHILAIEAALSRTASDFEGKCVVERAEWGRLNPLREEVERIVGELVDGAPSHGTNPLSGAGKFSEREVIFAAARMIAALRAELERRETLIAACEIDVKQADTLRLELAEARETGVKSMSMGEAELRKERDGLVKDMHEARVMIALSYAGTALYSDDGELQDNRVQPFIDFKRDSFDEIRGKMAQRALAGVGSRDRNAQSHG